ncbi:MAG: tetratricopeptide repeat protein [Kofleriaceae bacterium]
MDRGVLSAAKELFEARHYPGVVALIDDALEAEPDHVPLILMRARARFALHRDLEAQADLRDVIRLDPQCPTAYRLLGELAARRNEYESAAIFFREALRLEPTDEASSDWLAIIEATSRPATAASKLPAPAAVAGRFPRGTRPPEPPKQLARGSELAIKAKPMPRAPLPELPGFGDYLVESGILTRERLRAAQAYQRSMKVQLSTAIVTLGLATPQRIEWAAVAHQSQLARQR